MTLCTTTWKAWQLPASMCCFLREILAHLLYASWNRANSWDSSCFQKVLSKIAHDICFTVRPKIRHNYWSKSLNGGRSLTWICNSMIPRTTATVSLKTMQAFFLTKLNVHSIEKIDDAGHTRCTSNVLRSIETSSLDLGKPCNIMEVVFMSVFPWRAIRCTKSLGKNGP